MTIAPQTLARWRAELARAREALIRDYAAGRRASPLLAGLSRSTDRLLGQIWQTLELPPHAALVAVGGYGRGELYPQSDVDVLILLDDALPQTERARFEPLIGLLWDVGLPIGHSVRSLAECLSEGACDVTVQTNLMEGRLVAGERGLYERLCQALRAALDPPAFFEAKRLEQQNRHGRFADRALLLEPNIKESPGGLRDIQTALWVAQAAGLPGSLAGLARRGLLAPEEARRIAGRVRFLSALRIRLHLEAKRREDRLLFEFQEALAAQMGYAPQGGKRASERLMQHYYQAAREVSLANEILLEALRQHIRPPGEAEPLPGFAGFLRRGGRLDIADEALFRQRPEAIFESFLVLGREPELQGFGPLALRALWRAGRRIDAAFRQDAGNWARFRAILGAERGVTHNLRLMHRLGLLGRYIPAFGRVTGQLQHDLVHIYPVDEHILMVLRNLRRLALPQFAHEFPLAHRLMQDFGRHDLLYLAALFHDIAKGRGGDHSTLGAADARRFGMRHGLPRADTALVAWLVQEHLSLSRTAQKEDLSDPEVIARFAARCGTVERLTALYLLTVADIRGTNPRIWNAWKEKLLRELYLASRRVLEGGRPEADSVEAKKEQARAALRLYAFEPGAEDALWARLDEVYFLRLEAQEIAWQARRLLPLLGRENGVSVKAHIGEADVKPRSGGRTVVRARLAPIGEGLEVMVYAPDEPGLFARICGFFAGLRYSVLEARIHTTRDGCALDSFLVMDEADRAVPYRDLLSYIEYELAAILKARRPLTELGGGRLPRQLKHFPIEPEVSLAASEGGRGHVLSLAAGDRPGLLYDVARVLARHEASVTSAKIHTLGARAEDVFVLSGEALAEPEVRLALEQDLLGMLRQGG